MRRLLFVSLLALAAGCTARATCDLVTLGQPVPDSARPAPGSSWCQTHPRKFYEGREDLADGGGQYFTHGPFDEEGTQQCCLYVEDGGVAAKWLAYD